ncbi:MAG: hypothetical protein H7A25_22370 [Leptospiraceae bacterium]|nr:hypothetical protein [Leptospiraceae bacterium]MCP5502660.1 hypothetical protein [Leptospiraceae bacterium]
MNAKPLKLKNCPFHLEIMKNEYDEWLIIESKTLKVLVNGIDREDAIYQMNVILSKPELVDRILTEINQSQQLELFGSIQ